MDGVDLCRIIRTFDTETPIIFFTGEARLAKKQAAIEAGAQAYLIKPDDFEWSERTVTELINNGKVEQLYETQEDKDFSFDASKSHHLDGVR